MEDHLRAEVVGALKGGRLKEKGVEPLEGGHLKEEEVGILMEEGAVIQ